MNKIKEAFALQAFIYDRTELVMSHRNDSDMKQANLKEILINSQVVLSSYEYI